MLYILGTLVVVLMTLSMLFISIGFFIMLKDPKALENFRKIKFTPFKGNIIFIYVLIMIGVIGILSLFLILTVVFYRFIH